MKLKQLTVQEFIEIQQAPQHLQEPMAVAFATGKTVDEIMAGPISEFLTCRDRVLEENNLNVRERTTNGPD